MRGRGELGGERQEGCANARFLKAWRASVWMCGVWYQQQPKKMGMEGDGARGARVCVPLCVCVCEFFALLRGA